MVVAEMAPYDYGPAPREPVAMSARLTADRDGYWQVRLSWPAWDGDGVAVFTVVVGDGDLPQCPAAPEEVLDVTTETSVVDSARVNPLFTGLRQYEVWLHTGATVEEAVTSPPFLYAGGGADGRVVWPPTGFSVVPIGRDLVASWEPLSEQSFRIRSLTSEEARRRRPTATECQEVTTHGYQHRDVPAGVPFVYYLYAGVWVGDAVEWSAVPAVARAEVPVDLQAVTDLDVEPGDESRVALVWSSVAAGHVEIYTTGKAPPADLETAGQLAKDALREYPFHLDLDRRMPHPVIDEHGRSRMDNVDVSTESGAVYFIPITVHRQQARPGRPRRWLQARQPTNLVVVDRVEHVLVAFKWPRGAARVDLWRTAPDSRPETSMRPTSSLSREDYETFGGFLIPRTEWMIASGPCAIHLAGYISHAGEGKHSGLATVQATFPALVEYRIEVEQKQALRGVRTRTRVAVQSFESIHEVTFTLVWSKDRLPLSRDDGQRLLTATVSLTARQPADLGELPSLPEVGFVRLIADPYHTPAIALIDPPPDRLRLGHA